MNVDQILTEIDSEIAKLLEVRSTLLALETPSADEPSPVSKAGTTETRKPRKKMSAEGRARIAAAQKKRWAAKKKA